MIEKPLSLREIYATHSGKISDKWSIYLDIYDQLFQFIRFNNIQLLEIGIQNGGSLEIWGKYFNSASHLVGCDIDQLCANLNFDDPRISVIVENANTDLSEQKILSHSSKFDLIIDDGSHQSSDIIKSFSRYFPHLNLGGLYVAEDLHCSYWQEFQGGLHDPHSSISFFKLLADVVNHQHWGIESPRSKLIYSISKKYNLELSEDLLASIHSIEFFNSMCVVRKAAAARNVLGERVIAGKLALVDAEPMHLNGTSNHTPTQTSNPWAIQGVTPNENLPNNQVVLINLTQQFRSLETQVLKAHQSATQSEQSQRNQLALASQQIEAQLRQLAEREKAFSQQLQALQQTHEQRMNEQGQELAQREQSQREQLAQACQQIEAQQQHQAEREKAFGLQLRDLRHTHALRYGIQNTNHEHCVHTLNAKIVFQEKQLQTQTQQSKDKRNEQFLALDKLRSEIKNLHGNWTWRFTAPLRILSALIAKKNPPPHDDS